MSVQPAYASLGYVGVLNSGTANTNRDGTGTINTFAAASLRGLRVADGDAYIYTDGFSGSVVHAGRTRR